MRTKSGGMPRLARNASASSGGAGGSRKAVSGVSRTWPIRTPSCSSTVKGELFADQDAGRAVHDAPEQADVQRHRDRSERLGQQDNRLAHELRHQYLVAMLEVGEAVAARIGVEEIPAHADDQVRASELFQHRLHRVRQERGEPPRSAIPGGGKEGSRESCGGVGVPPNCRPVRVRLRNHLEERPEDAAVQVGAVAVRIPGLRDDFGAGQRGGYRGDLRGGNGGIALVSVEKMFVNKIFKGDYTLPWFAGI